TISNVKIDTAIHGDKVGPSVQGILTGNAANEGDYNFGNVSLDIVAPPLSTGTDAGTIENITLARGATLIAAGNGANDSSLAGGSIRNVTIATQSVGLTLQAGNGGTGLLAGAGGSIS